MKKILSFVLSGLFLLCQAGMVWAAPTTFTVSASIPPATGLLLTVTPINGTTNTPGTPSTTATTIPFGTLTFSGSPANIYLPVNYYSVAVGTRGGAGTPIVNVTYTEGTGTACPNIAAGTSATLGCLGTKTTATFVTADPTTNVESQTSLGKKRLIDLTGTAGELTSIPAGQYEKVYVGIWNGNTANTPPDPSNGKPFTNGDASGTYTGILTFTAVTL